MPTTTPKRATSSAADFTSLLTSLRDSAASNGRPAVRRAALLVYAPDSDRERPHVADPSLDRRHRICQPSSWLSGRSPCLDSCRFRCRDSAAARRRRSARSRAARPARRWPGTAAGARAGPAAGRVCRRDGVSGSHRSGKVLRDADGAEAGRRPRPLRLRDEGILRQRHGERPALQDAHRHPAGRRTTPGSAGWCSPNPCTRAATRGCFTSRTPTR